MGLKNFLHWLNETDEHKEKLLLDALDKARELQLAGLSEQEIASELEKFIIKGSNLPKLKDVKKAG